MDSLVWSALQKRKAEDEPTTGKSRWRKVAQSVVKKPTFDDVLEQCFPGATTEDSFVRDASTVLNQKGFSKDNSIALVSVCRDELTRTFVDTVEGAWGLSFNISSLAGFVFCGVTGFKAALAHAPTDANGRERYVVFAASHIAISRDGKIGKVHREGILGPSSACGALLHLLGELELGHMSLLPDSTDLEYSLLKQKMLSVVKWGDIPSLQKLTVTAYECIKQDVEATLMASIKNRTCDYAVIAGVQIHGPGAANYFWPATMYSVVNGVKEDLHAAYRNLNVSPSSQVSTQDLIDAVVGGSLEEVKRLLALNVPVDGVDVDSRTPLHHASAAVDVAIVEQLIDAGADLHVVDRRGFSVLETAVEHNRDEVAYLLKAKGCFLPPTFILERLSQACAKGAITLVKLLVECSSSIDDTVHSLDELERTPLHNAACHGHVEIVRYLLEKGARIEGTDRYGRSAIADAERHNHAEVVRVLQEHASTHPTSPEDDEAEASRTGTGYSMRSSRLACLSEQGSG